MTAEVFGGKLLPNGLWLGEVPPCRMLKFSTKACGGILPNHCYKPFFFRVWLNNFKLKKMNQIIQWSQGNPGAMTFLMSIMQPENVVKGITIIQKLEEAKSIRGTNLYVLWSDLCDRDMAKVETLCKNCPTDILEDACNRQDYSGRELVSEYVS